MVLASQIARPDVLRRFATSRRRKHTLRNVGIGALMLGAAVWVIWPGDRELGRGGSAAAVLPATSPAATPNTIAPSNPNTTVTTAIIAAERERLAAATAEQDAFIKRLRAGDGVPARPQSVDAAKLFDVKPEAAKASAKAQKPAAAASLTLGGTNAVPAFSPGLRPGSASTQPAANESKTESTSPTGPKPAPSANTATATPATPPPATLALALAPSNAIPAITDMVGRITLTTPAIAGTAGATLRDGMSQIADGKLALGRTTLSKVLTSGDPALTRADAQAIRDTLASVNKSLVFSDRALEDDTLVEAHTIASGELLSTVARKYKVTYQFLEQVNGVDARRIRVGQKIKSVKGPFHAVVDKSDFRLDAFVKDTDGTMIYITSFAVGIGKDDSTPVGNFICRQGGKLENPGWTHPRTGKHYGPDDAENPIGEYWIALQGTDEHTKGVRGYGIHGTIDPDSIGKQASLGCVRMLAKDIEQVYRLLVDGHSTVAIQP